MEKTVVWHEERAWLEAHALLSELSRPYGPMPNEMARCYLRDALHELTGFWDLVDHAPAAEIYPVGFESLEDARARLGVVVAQLLTDSPSLEESLRITRAGDWIDTAWAELETMGETA
ncbi:hypothetical protein DDE18_15630 [Nocardioides gansuensis]|uniref:Uncharacterized protein n=1 Tax=Nocardioides gansuensis TaxID=2138300 RepID=A0A2T8F8W3_9ACTN|nr:hypothetical protein [Nocardioides gansuensis]PVG82107.1 hypothetical protein DDE18_15630 [Nocardioides gansuensis]